MNQQSELEQLIEKFKSLLMQQNKSMHTVLNYSQDLELFFSWLDSQNLKLKKIGPELLGQYLNLLQKSASIVTPNIKPKWWDIFSKSERPLPDSFKILRSVATRRRHMLAIKKFFQFLIDAELAGFAKKLNPVRSSLHQIRLKDIDMVPTAPIYEQEVLALCSMPLSPEKEAMIRLLFYAGLRLAELQQLKWENVDFEKKSLKLIRKGGEWHTLKIFREENLFPTLMQFSAQQQRKSGYIFSNDQGTTYVSAQNLYVKLTRLLQKIKLKRHPISPHSFRKGCATWLYQETKDLLMVRNYLNHKDAKVTQIYIEIAD